MARFSCCWQSGRRARLRVTQNLSCFSYPAVGACRFRWLTTNRSFNRGTSRNRAEPRILYFCCAPSTFFARLLLIFLCRFVNSRRNLWQLVINWISAAYRGAFTFWFNFSSVEVFINVNVRVSLSAINRHCYQLAMGIVNLEGTQAACPARYSKAKSNSRCPRPGILEDKKRAMVV